VSSLKFYVDNPRIYSFVRTEGHFPTQDEILERLLALEHVRELVHDIKTNGGLIDPLIVRGGALEVLEGNSRLAAYRFLFSQDPIRWSHVKCTVLPADIPQALVFALLGHTTSRARRTGRHTKKRASSIVASRPTTSTSGTLPPRLG
tara:strand:- start:11319 stop:11759 length:441 start_codon:yes stop_codon:yes gene_type:complete